MWNDATWDMSRYIAKYGFQVDENHHDLTQQEVERIFQLDPEPPFQEQVNQYIIQAVQTHDLRNLSYFLHHYERMLNGHIHSFLRRNGELRFTPDRFLDLKLSCLGTILGRLPDYDPDKGAEFTTYIFPFLEDTLLTCRMGEEGYSFDSLDQYKRVRSAAWHASNSQTLQEAIAAFAAEAGCREETAAKYLAAAAAIHSRQNFFRTTQDEDAEATGEDVTRDDSWDYAEILSGGVRAAAVRQAFDALDYREQVLVEQRNAICMTCGRVSDLSTRKTFEDLAVMFEGSTASGAERAYDRAIEKLIRHLTLVGEIHAICLEQAEKHRKNKKIAAAVYRYQVDYDGEWGEIRFDFVKGEAEILALADWDTTRSQKIAKTVIRHVLSLPESRLPKRTVLAVEKG